MKQIRVWYSKRLWDREHAQVRGTGRSQVKYILLSRDFAGRRLSSRGFGKAQTHTSLKHSSLGYRLVGGINRQILWKHSCPFCSTFPLRKVLKSTDTAFGRGGRAKIWPFFLSNVRTNSEADPAVVENTLKWIWHWLWFRLDLNFLNFYIWHGTVVGHEAGEMQYLFNNPWLH